MSAEDDLQKQLEQLADVESAMAVLEKEAEKFRIEKTADTYAKRRSILRTMPKFWYIVLAENEDFVELIGLEDLKFLEDIVDVYVEYEDDIDRFAITIEFDGDKVPKQTVTKKFVQTTENGEEVLTSEPVLVEWPKELQEVNPVAIKEAKGANLSKEDKANYRAGMRSLFSWFAWTGAKPGKEFREGDDVARVIINDIYPNAVKYYSVALQGDDEGDDEEESSEGEELDLGDDDGDDEPPAKKQKTA